MDDKSVRQQIKDKVLMRPFKRVTGKPTFDQKLTFIEKAEDLTMSFSVFYPCAGEHGLLAGVARPPVYDPR